MARISGSIENDGRLIVVDEAGNVEYSEEHESGEYDIEDLVEGTKIVLFRRADGLTEGYGNVSTVESLAIPNLYTFGFNPRGELGFGDTVNRSTPTLLGLNTDWEKPAFSANSSYLIKTDGTLWGCGANGYGELGVYFRSDRSVFIQIGSDTDWSSLPEFQGSGSAGAIKNDGTLYVWGYNQYGQLGLNNKVHYSSPTKVGNETTWQKITFSPYHALALKNDGTLWTCGQNINGSLGRTGTYFSVFTRIGTDSDWSELFAYNRAIKSDGSLWVWGFNADGQLGLNDRTTRYAPSMVTSATPWLLCRNNGNFSIGIKTDGTMWSSGANNSGQLGIGNTTSKSTFTQIGTDTDWSDVFCIGSSGGLALKTDGTIWSWGDDYYGSLGQGAVGPNILTPTKIGTDSNWKTIVATTNACIVLK